MSAPTSRPGDEARPTEAHWALDRRPDLDEHVPDECRTGLAVLLP